MFSWTLKIDFIVKASRWWKLQDVLSRWLKMESDKAINSKSNQRLFSFGLIADVQYADIEDRFNYSKTKIRYYRNALLSLQGAVKSWNESPEDLSFVVQLGDLLDGFNLEKGKENSGAAAKLLLSELGRATAPVHHVLGNHELFNFTREELFERGFYSGYALAKKGKYMNITSASQRSLGLCKNGIDQSFEEFCRPLGVSSQNYPSFYHFSPCEGFRALFLDTYDLSVLGYDTDSEIYKKSHQILRSVNKNDEWNSPNNLGFHQRHFVGFNGGVSDRQLVWLKEQLSDAAVKKEKVFIFGKCHFYLESHRTVQYVGPFDADCLALLNQ